MSIPYVLVVEDEDALATLLDYNLMKEGFRVERAKIEGKVIRIARDAIPLRPEGAADRATRTTRCRMMPRLMPRL